MQSYFAGYTNIMAGSGVSSTSLHKNDLQTSRNSQFKWVELLYILQKNEGLVNIIIQNLSYLFVSKKRLLKQKKVEPKFLKLIDEYDPQNCLKAISVLKDLTNLKHNQYKFLYYNLTLGHALRLLIRESFYLNRTITSTSQSNSHFKRLISGWIQFLFYIHQVPENAANKLEELIIEHISLRLKNGITPCNFLVHKY